MVCRSIKRLRNPGELAKAEELRGAALQFVKKISGIQKPSKLHQQAFEKAVEEIAEASRRMLDHMGQQKKPPAPSSVV